MATLLVAARLCRSRQALLVVDPPLGWDSAAAAIDARAASGRSTARDALLYFPRLHALDRLRGRTELFASCGRGRGPDRARDDSSPGRLAAAERRAAPALALRLALDEEQRARLAQLGVNCFDQCAAYGAVRSARTLAAGDRGPREWRYLPARRLTLFVAACIERARAGRRSSMAPRPGSARARRWRNFSSRWPWAVRSPGRARGALLRHLRRAPQPPRDTGGRHAQPAVRLCHQQARRLSTPGSSLIAPARAACARCR